MEFFRYTLPNGIRCIHKRIKSPVAYCALTINAGSRDEKPSEFGIAHFTEHSLFKGTRTRRAHHINSRLEKLGGELNAFTTKEETVVHATTLKRDLPKATELIADIVFNSVFPEREVAREREVVIDEINSYKDSPPDRIYDEFEDKLFAGSALGHNILGAKKSVEKFTGETIRDFTSGSYNTDNMVFSMMGNLTEARFRRYAEKYFGDIPTSVRNFTRNAPGRYESFEEEARHNTHQGHCIMGSRAYDLHDPRRITLSLLTNMIGGPSANSALNVLLREKNGLTYNIEAAYTPYSDTGVASIYFGTDKDKVGKCIELIERVLEKFRTTALTTRQLAQAKKQFIGQLSISMDSNEGYVLSAGKSCLVYDEVDSPAEIYKKVSAITPSEVLETANEIFCDMSRIIYI